MKNPYRNADSDIADACEYVGEMLGTEPPEFEVSEGRLPLDEVLEWDDYGSWGEWSEGELVPMTWDEVRDELASFRGDEWASEALHWLDDGIPAIVLAELDDGTRMIADGRGRTSFAVGFNFKSVPVLIMQEVSDA